MLQYENVLVIFRHPKKLIDFKYLEISDQISDFLCKMKQTF